MVCSILLGNSYLTKVLSNLSRPSSFSTGDYYQPKPALGTPWNQAIIEHMGTNALATVLTSAYDFPPNPWKLFTQRGAPVAEVGEAREERLVLLRRTEVARRDPVRVQGGHLVLHQRHERAHDDGRTAEHERRDLEGDALAPARSHDHDDVAPGQDGVHGLALHAAEGLVAVDGAERGEGRGVAVHSCECV